MDKEHYHQVYAGISKKTSSKHAVITEMNVNERPLDFDGSKLDLQTQMYAMGNLSPVRMMVKKGQPGSIIYSTTYGRLCGFRHPNLLPVENYFTKGYGWLIVPCVDGSLEGWMKSDNGLTMFEGAGDKKNIAPPFRAMLIDLCSLFNKLSQKHLFPPRFGISDCYIKTISGVPKIRVVLTDVESTNWSPEDMAEKMRDLITGCCQMQGIELNDMEENFISYICDSTKCHYVLDKLQVYLPVFLENYPHDWSTTNKERYLFNIISNGDIPWHAVRSRINNSGMIKWPLGEDGKVVQELRDINSLGSKWEKKPDYPFEYIHQCQNCLKHFSKLPAANKRALGGSREAFIQKMEQWDPKIWIKLYHLYGPLDRKP